MDYKSFFMKPGYSFTAERVFHACTDNTRTSRRQNYKKFAGLWNNSREDWRMLAPHIFGEW